MTFVSCPLRDSILAETGHVVVTGGPGCGKTTVALKKALVRIEQSLQPQQRVLFLSFSRAAVTRIIQSARKDLPLAARRSLDIQTFHSFFWPLVQGHGYLLGAPQRIRLLSPHDERALRNGARDIDEAWRIERERLFIEEGRLAFDLFSPKALALLKGCRALREILAERYPLIIVDEAQDTGADQWGCLSTLAPLTQLVCLADIDQQIYDFRPDVSPERIKEIVAALNPLTVDLGGQNNRSPGVEIVRFGNDVLKGTPRRGAGYRGVSQTIIPPKAEDRDARLRSAVALVWKRVQNQTGEAPRSVGILTNWGKGVAIIARALQGRDEQREIPHRVAMDEAEVLLATRVIGAVLEPISDHFARIALVLELLADIFRAKGQVKQFRMLVEAAEKARKGKINGRAKCPSAIQEMLNAISTEPFNGEPGADWLRVRRLLETSGTKELKLVASLVVYLMAFNRGRKISDGLASVWQRTGCYLGARQIIEAAITEDQILGTDIDLEGIHVMTMHKSKGKEFDGVILVHLSHSSPFSSNSEEIPYHKSRRLLRVGITRARHHVLIASDPIKESPILT